MSEPQVAIVTGAGGALGGAIVTALSGRGVKIAAIDRAAAGDRLRTLERAGSVIGVALDVTSLEQWRSTLSRVEAELGAPDAAVLAAGAWQGGDPIYADGAEARWRAMLDVNLETARASLQALLPSMVSRKRGSIVVIGSRVVERPWESAGAAAYAAAKSALVTMMRAVAQEVLSEGVRLNAVLPSVLDTPANRHAMPQADPSQWVPTASLAEVIAFLLSDAARDVSGAAIPVYGRV
jgi:NAD(P)-dependent dehydrogenase (short-subunit alcohol dehydrogenase family)